MWASNEKKKAQSIKRRFFFPKTFENQQTEMWFCWEKKIFLKIENVLELLYADDIEYEKKKCFLNELTHKTHKMREKRLKMQNDGTQKVNDKKNIFLFFLWMTYF